MKWKSQWCVAAQIDFKFSWSLCIYSPTQMTVQMGHKYTFMREKSTNSNGHLFVTVWSLTLDYVRKYRIIYPSSIILLNKTSGLLFYCYQRQYVPKKYRKQHTYRLDLCVLEYADDTPKEWESSVSDVFTALELSAALILRFWVFMVLGSWALILTFWSLLSVVFGLFERCSVLAFGSEVVGTLGSGVLLALGSSLIAAITVVCWFHLTLGSRLSCGSSSIGRGGS